MMESAKPFQLGSFSPSLIRISLISSWLDRIFILFYFLSFVSLDSFSFYYISIDFIDFYHWHLFMKNRRAMSIF